MSDLLRQYIRSLLLEAPIDAWKKKHPDLTQEETEEVERYFSDLSGSGKFMSRLHTSVKDLTRMSLDELRLLHRTVMLTVERNLKSYTSVWLTGQLSRDTAPSLDQIDEDYIPELLRFQRAVKLPDVDIKDLEKIPDIQTLSLYLSEKMPSEEQGVEVSTKDMGKIGSSIDGWSLYMPHSTAASCELGKTGGKRDTTWCTTREDSSNLYMNYIGTGENTILFYVIKDGEGASKQNPLNKMSVGFVNGSPVFNGAGGGVSVDALNNGLTQSKFYSALGETVADEFLDRMEKTSNELEGKHPVKIELQKLASDPKALARKLDAYTENEQEAKESLINILMKYNIPLESYRVILDKSPSSIKQITGNLKAPDEVIDYILSGNMALSSSDIINLLNRSDIPRDMLVKIVDKRFKTSGGAGIQKALTFLSKDKFNKVEKHFFEQLTRQPNAPVEILAAIAKNMSLLKASSSNIAYSISKNPSTPLDTIRDLLNTNNSNVYSGVAENLSALSDEKISLKVYRYTKSDDGGLIDSIARSFFENIDPTSKIINKILSKSPDAVKNELAYLAGNEKIFNDRKLVDKLLASNLDDVKISLIKNNAISKEEIKNILLDSSLEVVASVIWDIQDDDLTDQLMHKIIGVSLSDYESSYKIRGAINYIVSSRLILSIRQDEISPDLLWRVRERIMISSKAPVWMLEVLSERAESLSGSSLYSFLNYLFENKAVTENIVRKFENHPDKNVANLVNKKLESMRRVKTESIAIRSLIRHFIWETVSRSSVVL
jgi:hypothetical protein